MQAIHKFRAGICPAPFVVSALRRLFGAFVQVELLSILLLLAARNGLAADKTVDLSPLVSKSTLVAPVDGSKQISVMLALPSSDPVGLAEFVHHLSSPGDPLYHQYITPLQFAERFGGNEDDYAYVKSWAMTNGLQVSQESVSRINLVVRGSVSQFQEIFRTQLNTYCAPDGQTFYSAGIKPSVPIEIASRVSGVIGLTSSRPLAALAKPVRTLGEDPLARSDKMLPDAAGGSGPGGTYDAKDLRKVYSIPVFGKLSKDVVVAVFEQGGYKVNDTDVYFRKNNLSPVKQTTIAVDKSPIQVEPAIELEACLDIDTVVGINPHVAEVLVYVDDYNYEPFNVAMPAAITAVADDHRAQILSISYGQDEGNQGNNAMDAENTALQQCAAEGITVLASSGDNGAYGGGYSYPYNVSDPASQPYITAVGGTTLFTSAHRDYISELAWDELAQGHGATGGGVSSYWAIPSYQYVDLGLPYITQNGGSATMRNVPDIAAAGDPLTGVGVYVKDDGGWVQVGGTSLSCPIWAGYLGAVDAALGYMGLRNLGLFNAILYAVGSQASLTPADYLHNVVEGSNGSSAYGKYTGYANGPGYSNTTGSGSIWGGGFSARLLIAQSLPGTPPRNFWFNAPIVKRTSFEITWATSNGATGYVMSLFHAGPYFNEGQCFVTKGTKLKVVGLVPNTTYGLYGSSVNASGAYQIPLSVQFTTPQ